MTFFPEAPVPSGRPGHVKACRGRVPTSLADFEGETEFTLSTAAGTRVVRGVGVLHGDWVRFHEKDAAHEHIRIWHIILEPDGGFTATSGPSAVLGWPFNRWPVLPG